MSIAALLIVASFVLALYALIESRGRGAVAWSCFCLSLSFLLGLLR